MEIKTAVAAVLAAASLVISSCGTNSNTAKNDNNNTSAAEQTTAAQETSTGGEMRDMTTKEIVKDMGLGINLGNTFESCGISGTVVSSFETGWGSPRITQELIQGYANAGFGVLRVPVAWSNMMAEDYTISEEYLARVNEVIGWAMDSGMYVILNEHWDGGWFEKFATETDECMKKYSRIWEQLCDYYGSYGDKLMFESLNEELHWDSLWNQYGGSDDDGKKKAYELANSINQKFVDIVRASGGNNAKRHLLIAGYNTDIDLTCDELFVMPDDPAGRCAVSVHYYTPSTYTIIDKDQSWGKARKVWGNSKDLSEMDKLMDKIKEHFVDKGIPVIMGEYGCVAHKNKEPENIRLFNLIATEEMLKRDICPVLWDTTGTFYDRYMFVMKDEEFQKGLTRLKNGESLREELLAAKEAAKQAAAAETDSAA